MGGPLARRAALAVAAAALSLLPRAPAAALAAQGAAAKPPTCSGGPEPEGHQRADAWRTRLCGSSWRRPLSHEAAAGWRSAASRWSSGWGRPCVERPPGGRQGTNKVESLTETRDFPPRAGLTKVFYINLDSSLERREFMEGQLNRSGVPYERFPAVDAREIEGGKWDRYYLRNNITVCGRYHGKWGSIACALSHRLVWEKIAADDPGGTGLYLVLEDDVLLPEGWERMASESVSVVPDDWSVVKLALWGSVDCDAMVNEFVALDTSPVWTRTPHGPFKDTSGTYWFAGSSANLVSPVSIPTIINSVRWGDSCGSDWNVQSDGAHRSYVLVDPLFTTRVRAASGSEVDRFASDRAAAKGPWAGASAAVFARHPAPPGAASSASPSHSSSSSSGPRALAAAAHDKRRRLRERAAAAPA